MAQSAHTGTSARVLELVDYLTIIRRRKLIILAVTIITVASVFLWSMGGQPLYQSTARVVVQATQTLPGQTSVTWVNLETEAQVARSVEVAEIVAKKLNYEGAPKDLLGGLSVTVEAGAGASGLRPEILDFSYTAASPAPARDRAQAFAEGYLEYRQVGLLDRALDVQEPIRNAIEEKTEEIRRAEERLAAATNPILEEQLAQEIDRLNDDIDFFEQQLLTLSPPSELHIGQIIEPARLSSGPISTGRVRLLAIAFMTGLIAGIGVAFLRERLDDSLRGRDDLETYLGAPVLAVIPRVRAWKVKEEPYLVTLNDPDSAAAEAFRTLRIGLLFSATRTASNTILVTSTEAGEGKTTVVANLGVAFAAAGKRVIVISADLRKPRLDTFFQIPSSPGLTNVLAGEATIDRVLRRVARVPNLRVLPSGPVPGNPAELLSSPIVGSLLKDLEADCDIILVDAAPVLAVSDALALSRFVDGMLFVSDASKTKRSAVAQARRLLRQVNATVLGAVLSNDDPSKRSYAHYYDTYGVSYDAGDTVQPVPEINRRSEVIR